MQIIQEDRKVSVVLTRQELTDTFFSDSEEEMDFRGIIELPDNNQLMLVFEVVNPLP